MGDVLLARHDGAAGIKKFCVVKTLRAHLHGDKEYVRRFVDEATVVVQLSHRNICQVFDVGKSDENIFLVMEHITGFDLGSVRERADARGTPLSRAIAIHVVGEMLEALDYAHRHVDSMTGKPLGLVHRDVSPHNAMLNGEGELKLIDFGLAATGVQLSEEAGSSMVMGKLAYMAPEHARGELIDGRADQFSSAVVLYELLTGARYYGGMTPQQVWSVAGMGTHVPPHLEDLPQPLVAILRRALAPDRDHRYATCGDFREALASYAYDHHLRVTTRDVRELMQSLFDDELQTIRKMLQDQAAVSVDVLQQPPSERFERIATTAHGLSHEPTELLRARDRLETPSTTLIRADAFTARTGPPRASRFVLVGAALAIVLALATLAVVGSADRGDTVTATALPDLPPAPPPPAARVVDAGAVAATPPPRPVEPVQPVVAPTEAPRVTSTKPERVRPSSTKRPPRATREPKPSKPPASEVRAKCLAHCTMKTMGGRDPRSIATEEFVALKQARTKCQSTCEENGGP